MRGPTHLQDHPGAAVAEEGQVLLEGPAGALVTMTPDAAEETARRLRDAARQAAASDREGATPPA